MEQQTGTCNSILPAQKCIAGNDIRDLADHELLAAILGTGTKNRNVLSLAADIIGLFGGLAKVHTAGLRELSQIPGVGMMKAVRVLAAFELGRRLLCSNGGNIITLDSPEKVWRLLCPEIGMLSREEFRVITLNNKNHVIKKSTVSMGTISEALIHPREIFREAIREAGASIIVAHNHPSGVLTPSREDIAATKRIRDAGAIIGIELLDHVIICATSYLSMKEAGYL